jgi:O-antigen ligase
MAAWVAGALVALVILKPQEFVPALAGLPLVHVAFAGVLVALVRDLVHRRVRLSLAPQVPFVLAFFGWALIVTAVKRPAALGDQLVTLAIVAGIFGAVATACASAAGLRAFAFTLAGCAAVVTVVALVQSQGAFGCFLAAPEDWEGRGELVFDGRPCDTATDCRVDAPVADGNYRCERRGPLSTATIGGRVRYRGALADPNELSLALAMALPFAFALAGRRKGEEEGEREEEGRRPVLLPPLLGDGLLRRVSGFVRAVPATALLVASGGVVVLSQSRSGLLAFLTVVGLQAIRRAGAWGVVAGCLMAPPLLLIGGRSGTEAEESSDERVEILREAFELMRGTKGFGLGAGQFSDESSLGLTAHNAYVLAAAEVGVVGLVLFSLALYFSLKVPVVVWLDGRGGGAGRFAPAIAVAMCGAMVGILFLSWAYKDYLYLVMGASAALCSAARAEDPRVRVRVSVKEVGVVALAAFGLLAAVYVGSRIHK